MGVKFTGFDTKKILRQIEKDLKQHPEKVLNSHKGDKISGTCSKCGETTIKILSNGKARCEKCGRVMKVDLNISFK